MRAARARYDFLDTLVNWSNDKAKGLGRPGQWAALTNLLALCQTTSCDTVTHRFNGF
jgi:hypothetical protein